MDQLLRQPRHREKANVLTPGREGVSLKEEGMSKAGVFASKWDSSFLMNDITLNICGAYVKSATSMCWCVLFWDQILFGLLASSIVDEYIVKTQDWNQRPS